MNKATKLLTIVVFVTMFAGLGIVTTLPLQNIDAQGQCPPNPNSACPYAPGQGNNLPPGQGGVPPGQAKKQ